MKRDKKIVVLPFSDEGDSPLFWDKTVAVELHEEAVAKIRKMSEDCKQRGYADISLDTRLQNWTIDADPTDIDAYQVKNPVFGRDPDHLIKHFGDLRSYYGMSDYPTVSVDAYGNVYFGLSFAKVAGEGSAQIRLKDLLEMFPELREEEPTISREDFMAFWRSDKMQKVLTPDDRMEIFMSAPVGSSDLTKEVLDDLLGDYDVTGIRIVDTSVEHRIDMVLGKTDKVSYRYIFDSIEEKNAFLCGMDEVFGYEDYESVDFDVSDKFTRKRIHHTSQQQERLKENNMLFREGDFVEMAEPQDGEHEAFLSNFQNEVYVVAEINEKSETYLLRHQLAHTTSKSGYIVYKGMPAHFTDADLSLVSEDEFRMDVIVPLAGRFNPSLGFSEMVSTLKRPYIIIPKEQEEFFSSMVDCGLDGKRTDFVLYRGTVCTFGEADGEKMLMPIRESVDMKQIAIDFPEIENWW